MTGEDFRMIAWMLALSLATGIAILTYGAFDRSLPPEIDLVWEVADQIRGQLQDGSLVLKEGETHERVRHKYRITLQRLAKDTSSFERYILKIRSMYDLLPTTTWRPSSWDLALIASGSGSDRSTYLVAARKSKG